MVKLRPVLVISPSIKTRSGLTTVVALSTTAPNPVCDYHYLLPRSSMPQIGSFQKHDTWVKGDMIYAVGFQRLDLIRLGKKKDGKRLYFTDKLSRATMKDVYSCVLHSIGIGAIANHL